MRSAAKLSYPGVARALGLSKSAKRSEDAEAMRDDLQVMWELSRLLRARRLRRGALDFDLPEAQVVLDTETGAPLDVMKRAHDPGVKKAYQLIEELMLLANETVARQLVEKGIPTIFRCHAQPDQEKLERFVTMCNQLDVAFDPEDATDPKLLAAFLKRLAVHPQKQVLHMLLLRAMKQAAYDVANVGHFGLASEGYLHFTSPIRRYPDLVVHRTVKALLRREPIDIREEAVEKLRTAATTASDCERRGMEVEREVVDLYRALYMRSHLGAVFQGTVTGIVGTGLFVAIDHPFVDVLVRLESLGRDSYEIDEAGLAVVGLRSGERIGLGDTLVVQIEDVAILRRAVYGRRVVQEEEIAAEEDGQPKRKQRVHVVEADGKPRRERGAVRKAAPAKRVVKKTGKTTRTKTKKTR
jgi:ribonuclease R